MSARTSLRRRVAAVLAASGLVLSLAACSGDGETGPAALPAPLPEITLAGFDGAPDVELAELEGPAVINLWASWCTPCRDEMPVLEEFSQKYAEEVAVLGVDFQDPQYGAAKELVAETGVTYPLVRDVDGELDRLDPFPHVRGLPFMAFVDADGQVVGQEFVIVDDLAELEALVDEHLGLPEAAPGGTEEVAP